MATQMPRLVSPRVDPVTLEAVRNVAGGFDIDAYHVMDQRDNQLIAEEVLHGVGSETFVYDFDIRGTKVTGISVVGARHLANLYRGLKHRIVGSVQKTGALFEYRAFPSDGFAGDTRAAVVPDLATEPDYYSCIVELQDIKTGNSIMVECREERFGHSRAGDQYEKPNFQKIAQSKAYRNAVLALVPQDVVIRWKAEMLKLKKGETITGSVLSEKRSAVLRYAAAQGIPIDRHRLTILSMDQIAGLGDAAREGALPRFAQAAVALGLMVGEVTDEPAAPAPEPPRRGRPRKPTDEVKAPEPPEPPAEPSGDPAPPDAGAEAMRAKLGRPMFE